MTYEITLSLSSLGLAPNANPNTVRSLIDVTGVHNSPSKALDANVCDDAIVGPNGGSTSTALGCSQSTPEPSSFSQLGLGILILAGAMLMKLKSKKPSAHTS